MTKQLALKLSPLFLCLIFISGCGKIKIDWVYDSAKSSSFVTAVAKELSDNPKAECLYIYKYFAANAKYVETHGADIGTTTEWQILCEKVNKDYGWDIGKKDTGLTEVVRKELAANGFEDPKSLSDVDNRNKLAKVLNEAAQGALKAYESK